MADKGGKIRVSIIKAQGGKLCVAINDYRVAGNEPSLQKDNIVQEWTVPRQYLLRALGLV